MDAVFWLAIGKVIWVDALLSGDNALVIAMACDKLPSHQKKLGLIFGAMAAVLMRIMFTGVISQLMEIPYLRAVGAATLAVVAVKMCVPDDGDTKINASDRLLRAIGTIVMADLVMSLDNMVAVAAVAQGNWVVLAIGLAVSIPMIVAGAAAITYVLTKLPILIWAGAGLLGWIAGDLLRTDTAITWIPPDPSWGMGFLGCCLVICAASIWRNVNGYRKHD